MQGFLEQYILYSNLIATLLLQSSNLVTMNKYSFSMYVDLHV